MLVFVLALFDVDGSALLEDVPTAESNEVLSLSRDESVVVRIVDGDTIELESGEIVRYIGIDTPETVHPQKDVQCYGQEAKMRNTELVMGRHIYMSKDVSETDRYGRLLRYVYVEDEKGNEVFVNDTLVREGYAVARTFPPDVAYQQQFARDEQAARESKLGLWSTCYE